MRNDIDIMSLNFIRIQTPTTNDWQASWLLQIIKIELWNLDSDIMHEHQVFPLICTKIHAIYLRFILHLTWCLIEMRKLKVHWIIFSFIARPKHFHCSWSLSLVRTQHRWANGWRPVLTAVPIDIFKFNLTFLPTHFNNSMTTLWHMKINCVKGIRNYMYSSINLEVLECLSTR